VASWPSSPAATSRFTMLEDKERLSHLSASVLNSDDPRALEFHSQDAPLYAVRHREQQGLQGAHMPADAFVTPARASTVMFPGPHWPLAFLIAHDILARATDVLVLQRPLWAF
jgi:hypothetical protein